MGLVGTRSSRMQGPRFYGVHDQQPLTPMTAPDRWFVLKFGGTSVSRRERWDTSGRLARETAERRDARVLVVVSALSGAPNELQAIATAATAADIAPRADALAERHRAFAAELGLDSGTALGGRPD